MNGDIEDHEKGISLKAFNGQPNNTLYNWEIELFEHYDKNWGTDATDN